MNYGANNNYYVQMIYVYAHAAACFIYFGYSYSSSEGDDYFLGRLENSRSTTIMIVVRPDRVVYAVVCVFFLILLYSTHSTQLRQW